MTRIVLLISFIFFFGKNFIIHSHHIQQTGSNFTLLNVLGLVVNAWTASPTNQKEDRDVIYFLVSEGCQRIYNITLTTILHIHTSRLSCCQIMTGSKSHGCTFIGCNNIMCRIKVVRDVRTDVLQQTVRHTGKTVNTFLS